MDHTVSSLNSGKEPAALSRATLALRVVLYAAFMGAVLFISAGRLDWVMGWVYLFGYFGLLALLSMIMPIDQELADERMNVKEGAKQWDIIIVAIVTLLGGLALQIVAGLDMRNSWLQSFPVAISAVALVIAMLGTLIGSWAMATNRYFSRFVRVQEDRGQVVVSSGPYRYVRHPNYIGSIFNAIGTALALQSVWALVPGGLVAVLLILRTGLEDRTLQKELPGYREYARRVRWKLLPGIW